MNTKKKAVTMDGINENLEIKCGSDFNIHQLSRIFGLDRQLLQKLLGKGWRINPPCVNTVIKENENKIILSVIVVCERGAE